MACFGREQGDGSGAGGPRVHLSRKIRELEQGLDSLLFYRA
jgi:hypothetical protein